MPEVERQQHRTRNEHLVRSLKPDRMVSPAARADTLLSNQQHLAGNQATQRFARSCPRALPSPSACPFGGACHACPAAVQAKLKVNEPDDEYEQEADRTADQVMRMPELQSQCQVESVRSCPRTTPKLCPSKQGAKRRVVDGQSRSKAVQQVNQENVIQREDDPPAQGAQLPTAQATLVTRGRVRCCRHPFCPTHLGVARPRDPRPQNGVNIRAVITRHRAGVEYGFVQTVHSRQCMRFSASLGGGWARGRYRVPGSDDSPEPFATCRRPNARGEILMADGPGLIVGLNTPPEAGLEEMTQRANLTTWVIARQRPGRWRRISGLVRWHSVTRIRRGVAGNWELVPGRNRLGTGYTRVGGCPPPAR